MTTPTTAEALAEAQAKEYGTYVATRAIDLDSVRAFNKGDAVPVSHVERGLVPSDAVAKTSTKAGQAVLENGTK